MSARDLKAILNTPEIFLFLPTVNYVYLFSTTNLPLGFILCCAAGGTSALVYNILDGIPANNATKVRLGITVLLVLGGSAWLLLLIHSAIRLYMSFEQSTIIHEALFFTTLVFVVVVTTNILLSWYEKEYQTTL